jgi:steroid delta-isomerase-like uncharacterized protein
MHFFTAMDRMRGGPDPAICAPGYTAQVNGQALDLAGHTQMAAGFYSAFSDLNHIIEDTVADEEKVAVEFRLEGTHSSDLMGLAATGKKISIQGLAVLAIKDGKVTEVRTLFDGATMQKQLGASQR